MLKPLPPILHLLLATGLLGFFASCAPLNDSGDPDHGAGEHQHQVDDGVEQPEFEGCSG